MLKKKTLSQKELKTIMGGTPGGFDFVTAGPNAAQNILNSIRNYFK
ncbi:bacteriocin [Brochothrix campestris]|nr:bacteriocin [Brochothrix campestris]